MQVWIIFSLSEDYILRQVKQRLQINEVDSSGQVDLKRLSISSCSLSDRDSHVF